MLKLAAKKRWYYLFVYGITYSVFMAKPWYSMGTHIGKFTADSPKSISQWSKGEKKFRHSMLLSKDEEYLTNGQNSYSKLMKPIEPRYNNQYLWGSTHTQQRSGESTRKSLKPGHYLYTAYETGVFFKYLKNLNAIFYANIY